MCVHSKVCSWDFPGPWELRGFLLWLMFVPAILLLDPVPSWQGKALSSFIIWKMRRTWDGWAQIPLIPSHCCARQAEGRCKPSVLDFPPWDGDTEAPTSSHPTAEVGKQLGHEVCPAGLSLAHGGASWMELLTCSSSRILQGGGNMRRVLAGAENQWVLHGLPWLSCMIFPVISLELECSREPAWGTMGA